MIQDIILISKIKTLDKTHCSNVSFFREFRLWLNDNNTNEERNVMKTKLTSHFIKSYTKMHKYRKQLLSRCKDRLNPPKTNRDKYLRNTYNITEYKYEYMFKEQSGCCKICKITHNKPHKYFFVDHCHESGKVRGLLCQQCNTGLGMFKDTISSLKEAIQYLKDNSIK